MGGRGAAASSSSAAAAAAAMILSAVGTAHGLGIFATSIRLGQKVETGRKSRKSTRCVGRQRGEISQGQSSPHLACCQICPLIGPSSVHIVFFIYILPPFPTHSRTCLVFAIPSATRMSAFVRCRHGPERLSSSFGFGLGRGGQVGPAGARPTDGGSPTTGPEES